MTIKKKKMKYNEKMYELFHIIIDTFLNGF